MTNINEVINDFDKLKSHLTDEAPGTIQQKVAVWAFEEAENVKDAIRKLEHIDCGGCFAPAPIYYFDMAAEIAECWNEIDGYLWDYREETGQAWTPRPGASLLNHLWFAYEWVASQLAGELQAALED